MLAGTVREAAAVAGASALVALVANAVRPSSLPLVARVPYETLVPCPEPGGPVLALEPGDPAIASERSFLVDGRGAAEYHAHHLPAAVNAPFDWLEPLPEDRLHELARAIATSRATRVVVYGDGGRPDSGEYLGREISGRGIKNVYFVRGGAPALLSGGG
jgi:rhodanese-related sulfurtransferase